MKILYRLTCILPLCLLGCTDKKSTHHEQAIADDSIESYTAMSSESIQEKTIKPADSTTIQQTQTSKTDTSYINSDTLLIARDSAINESEPQQTPSKIFSAPLPELEDHILEHEIPTEATIGIRPYANAYVIKLNPKVEYRGKKYATIELASPDTPEEVLKYYHRWKENWFFIKGAGVYTFKKDKDKYFRETNTLQVLAYDKTLHPKVDTLLSFDAQTIIRIYYETD